VADVADCPLQRLSAIVIKNIIIIIINALSLSVIYEDELSSILLCLTASASQVGCTVVALRPATFFPV